MIRKTLAAYIIIGSLFAITNVGIAGIDTLAVAPFIVIGDSNNIEMYEYGLPEAIANHLARVPGLTVVERMRLSAVLQELKLSQTGLIDNQQGARIGELLGAKIILLGTVQKSVPDVRVFVRAVSVASGEVIFSIKAEQHIAKFGDIFKFEDLLAKKVVMQLGLSVAQDEIDKIDKASTSSEDAFQYYSVGFKYLDNRDYTNAMSSFKRATIIDKHFDWAQQLRLNAEKAFEELDHVTK